MPLYVQNGNLLNKTGTLGTSVGCCCDSPPPETGCSCSGSPITVPRSMTIEFTLGTLLGSSGSCTHAEATSFIEGSYVCPFWFSTSSQASYRVILGNGVSAGVTWYCANGGSGQSLDWGISICVESNTCFCRFRNNAYFFGPPGSGFPSKAKSLCNVTTGDTTPLDYTGNGNIRMEEGPIGNCFGPDSTNFRSYLVLATLTPSW